jgi:hypothetical protein
MQVKNECRQKQSAFVNEINHEEMRNEMQIEIEILKHLDQAFGYPKRGRIFESFGHKQ